MNLWLWPFIFAILSATEMRYFPLLVNYVSHKGCISGEDCPRTELSQILIKVKENSGGSWNSSALRSDLVHLTFREVLDKVNVLAYHQSWFQHGYTRADYNVEIFHFFLYWTKKELNFLLSIKPCIDRALRFVLETVEVKVSRLLNDYNKMNFYLHSYSSMIMNEYQEACSPAPLLPFDVKWATNNLTAQPKVHFILMLELGRRKMVDMKFVSACKKAYFSSYERIVKKSEENAVMYALDNKLTPDVILNSLEHFSAITNAWLSLWLLGMRIRGAIPSPVASCLSSSLIESFNMEIIAMDKVLQAEGDAREYALEFSCLHMDYLSACMRFALLFNLLSPQDHDDCLELISAHRRLAVDMIDSIARKNQ